MRSVGAALLLSVTAVAAAASPLVLPLRDTDGWSMEVPVKAGARTTIQVTRGVARIERQDRNGAFEIARVGTVVTVAVKAGTPTGTTSCFKIHTPRKTAYTLCPAVDVNVPAQAFVLR